jgi:hypothetical protein
MPSSASSQVTLEPLATLAHAALGIQQTVLAVIHLRRNWLFRAEVTAGDRVVGFPG